MDCFVKTFYKAVKSNNNSPRALTICPAPPAKRVGLSLPMMIFTRMRPSPLVLKKKKVRDDISFINEHGIIKQLTHISFGKNFLQGGDVPGNETMKGVWR